MTAERVLDLNIFYREDWTPEGGTTWSPTFTIDPYIYESDGYVRKHETGYLIECDEYETEYLAKQFPESEYGSDFWVFADEVDIPTRRIAKVLNSIDLGLDYVPHPRSATSVLEITDSPVTMT